MNAEFAPSSSAEFRAEQSMIACRSARDTIRYIKDQLDDGQELERTSNMLNNSMSMFVSQHVEEGWEVADLPRPDSFTQTTADWARAYVGQRLLEKMLDRQKAQQKLRIYNLLNQAYISCISYEQGFLISKGEEPPRPDPDGTLSVTGSYVTFDPDQAILVIRAVDEPIHYHVRLFDEQDDERSIAVITAVVPITNL